jgi:hypothetical protein
VTTGAFSVTGVEPSGPMSVIDAVPLIRQKEMGKNNMKMMLRG